MDRAVNGCQVPLASSSPPGCSAQNVPDTLSPSIAKPQARRPGVLAVLWQRLGPYHLARLQAAAKHFEKVVAVEIASRDHYAWETTDADCGLERLTLFRDRPYESLSRREIASAVAARLNQIDPQFVAINGWSVPEARAALRWTNRHGRYSILMSETFEPSRNRIKEFVKARRVRRFHAAVVGGRWHANYLQQLGFPADRIRIGYDAVDNDHFTTGARAAQNDANHQRIRLGLPHKYCFANTRFLPRKKIDVLLKAYAKYRRDVADPWRLVISGSGQCEQDWKRLSTDLAIDAHVAWPGFVQYADLPAYYGLASAFVHIASREAWGLVINEAAACGLPLIVGRRVGASCELVTPDNGILVDPDDIDSVAEALIAMTHLSENERLAMSTASRAKADNYRPDRFGTALAELVASSGK